MTVVSMAIKFAEDHIQPEYRRPRIGPDHDRLEATSGAVSAAPATSESAAAKALQRVAAKIPAEIIAAYIPAFDILKGVGAGSWQWVLFGGFVIVTPIAVLAKTVDEGKKQKKRDITRDWRHWPWWNMVASAFSFGAWAIALPGSVATAVDGYNPALGTLVIVVVSLLLGILARFFEPD